MAHDDPTTSRKARIKARLRTLPVLPTLFTSGNLAAGVTAILCATHDMLGWGAMLVFLAMICDLLDGKVARMTGTDGAFGAELDSLADVVSFGVAPAFLLHRAVIDESAGFLGEGERLIWVITIFYAVLTSIRLARYNVEHGDEPAGPMAHFRGLPSPGAAALLCSWIGLYAYLRLNDHAAYDGHFLATWLGIPFAGFEDAFRIVLLFAGLLMAVLMVSTLPFPHIGNTFLNGKVSFRRLILLLLVVGTIGVWHIHALALVTTAYVFGCLVPGLITVARRWSAGKDLFDEDEEEDREGDDALES